MRRRKPTNLSRDSDLPGLLDTNVFVHAYTHDDFSQECQRFLAALERGEAQARLEPLVLHELSYVLPRYLKQITREQMARYLLLVLSWNGVQADMPVLLDTVERWRDTPGLAFVDAYLASLASRDGCPVYTKT